MTDMDITAKLCNDCAKINGRVQELVRVLEVTSMKIDYQLNSIAEIMWDAARTPSRMIHYHQRMTRLTRDLGSAGFMESAERFRKELSTECSKILLKSQPRVAIARMDTTLEIKKDNSFQGTSFPDDEFSALPPLDSDSKSDVKIEDSLISDSAEVAVVVGAISNDQSVEREQKLFSFVEEIETTDVTLVEPVLKVESKESSPTEYELTGKKKHIQERKKGSSKTSPSSSSTSKKATTTEINSSNSPNLLKTLTEKGEGYCKICKKNFTTRYGWQEHHKNFHLGIRKFKCDHCEKRFGRERDLRRHRDAVHFHRRFKCTVSGCSSDYSTTDSLRTHQKAVHPEIVVPRHRSKAQVTGRQCKICQKSFLSVLNLKKHHLNVHLDAKRFECDICGKKFTQASTWKVHRDSVHFGIRHFCDFPGCGKDYSQQDSVKAHQKVAHRGWHPSDKIPNSTIKAVSSNCLVSETAPCIKQEFD